VARPFLSTLYADVLVAAGDRKAGTVVLDQVRARAVPGYPRPAEVWDLLGWLLRRPVSPDVVCAVKTATDAFGMPPRALQPAVEALLRRDPCAGTVVGWELRSFSDPPAPPMSRTTPAHTARRIRP
jgi:hypothetical protein